MIIPERAPMPDWAVDVLIRVIGVGIAWLGWRLLRTAWYELRVWWLMRQLKREMTRILARGSEQ